MRRSHHDPERSDDGFAVLDRLEAYPCPFPVVVGTGSVPAARLSRWAPACRATVLHVVARLGERALAVAEGRATA